MQKTPHCLRTGSLAALLALMCAAPAHAQADPTRPAPAWLAAQPRAPGSEAPAEARTPDVQIMVIGPARRFAIVNGEAVYAGELHNGAKLVGIEHGGVVWQRAGTQEKSSMSPGVQKTEPGSRDAQPSSPNIRKKVLIGGVP
jgi:hypothetical protein